MTRLLSATIVGLLVATAALAQSPPGRGEPFGGDDAGCVPDIQDHRVCGDGLARAFAMLVGAVTKCHQRQATARLKHTFFDEESCERATPSSGGRSAAERFNAKLSRLTPRCSPAQVSAAMAERDTLLAAQDNPGSLDALNGRVYCDSTSGALIDDSTGGGFMDDAGWVPATTDMDRCERSVGKNLAVLVSRVIRCHVKQADRNFRGSAFDEDGCEDTPNGHSALDRYNGTADKLSARGICPSCQSNAAQRGLGTDLVARFDADNGAYYTCPGSTTTTTTTSSTTTTIGPTTTTTSSTTTTTLVNGCACAGGPPSRLVFTTGVGSGTCGHLDADGNPNFFPLLCGGLYFGGAGVGVPLPSTIPDQASSITKTSCTGTTITLTGTTSAETGSIRNCTSAGCLFGPPLPIPNTSHNSAATSTCVINTVAASATGTADCSAGTTTGLSLPLSSGLFLTGDLLASRCSGGPTPGKGCTTNGDCGTGGTCVNDTGRCTGNGAACTSDANCTSGTCETGACAGGANSGKGCIVDTDCPSSTCKTLIQPCPICNATTHVCNGGANDGLACMPGDSAINGDFPTSHDCPPPGAQNIGSLPIAFLLDSGTVTKTAVDMPSQFNVFCGFCKNKVTNTFRNPAASCTSDADCAGGANGTTSCAQRTSGAFTPNDVARTISLTGSAPGSLMTGGPAQPATIVSIFCIPPTFNPLVDSAADLPGPGAVALKGTTQVLP